MQIFHKLKNHKKVDVKCYIKIFRIFSLEMLLNI